MNSLICLDGERTAAGAFDFLDELFGNFGRSGIAEYDVGTVTGKTPDNGGADTA